MKDRNNINDNSEENNWTNILLDYIKSNENLSSSYSETSNDSESNEINNSKDIKKKELQNRSNINIDSNNKIINSNEYDDIDEDKKY